MENEKKQAESTSSKKKKKSVKKERKIGDLKSKITELETQLQDVEDKYLRVSAEFDNYRRRTVKERMELIKTAGESLLVDFLPFLDNIERAVKSMDQTENTQSVQDGIRLIYKNLTDFVSKNGVKAIDVIGKKFNTDLHEAVTKMPVKEKKKKGKVIDCIEKGYLLNDKVIRYSKVVVGE